MTIRRRVEEMEPAADRGAGAQLGEYEDTQLIKEEEVSRSQRSPGDLARAWIRTLGLWVFLALGIVETLLAFRLAFQLAAANPNNGFVDFIYDLSGPLADPFQGIVANRNVAGDGLLETATVIAMVVFLVAAVMLFLVLRTIAAYPSPVERATTARTRRRTRAQHEERA